MLRSRKVCISGIGLLSQIHFPFMHGLITVDRGTTVCVTCCSLNQSADTGCLVVGVVSDDQDAEMRKAR